MNPRAGEQIEQGKVRLDKWLWAARFFKSRQLAHDALELGRVWLNGERVKASRTVNLDDHLLLRIHQFEYHICVTALATQRKGARDAQLMYRETPESFAAREAKAALLRAEHASFPYGEGRPSKKGRREIDRFKESF
jgi:ribosome-associated heat shock protein Hsp15